jgi:hypothetical protein
LTTGVLSVTPGYLNAANGEVTLEDLAREALVSIVYARNLARDNGLNPEGEAAIAALVRKSWITFFNGFLVTLSAATRSKPSNEQSTFRLQIRGAIPFLAQVATSEDASSNANPIYYDLYERISMMKSYLELGFPDTASATLAMSLEPEIEFLRSVVAQARAPLEVFSVSSGIFGRLVVSIANDFEARIVRAAKEEVIVPEGEWPQMEKEPKAYHQVYKMFCGNFQPARNLHYSQQEREKIITALSISVLWNIKAEQKQQNATMARYPEGSTFVKSKEQYMRDILGRTWEMFETPLYYALQKPANMSEASKRVLIDLEKTVRELLKSFEETVRKNGPSDDVFFGKGYDDMKKFHERLSGFIG